MAERSGTCIDCGEPFLARGGKRKRCNTCADEHDRVRQLARKKAQREARAAARAAVAQEVRS
ncbi:hypothetical protein SAMN04488061_2846 [Filomicrobium insigne]|uniref:Uncharacterized protein n=1 Tax=Filomicrobium insigne TaxID=418854 RepID=A0A1H0SDB1_9HYPH|nr:hypothetical protein [Filomicrobium insigne]SDP39710.1 hypothetical protein SAMN04488061_2846 [Filomicrobium insigne]